MGFLARAFGALETAVLPDRIATFVEIASNNACNLSCVYCYGLGHPESVRFTREAYARYMDDLLPRADILVPSAGSEPFAADIELAADKVIEHGRQMLLITNGTFPAGEIVSRLGQRLYRLQMSIDSHRPEVFEKMRPGAKFEIVMANLREAIRILAAGNLLARLVVSVVLTRDTVGDVADTVRFFACEGVRAFLIQDLYRLDPRLDVFQPEREAVEKVRVDLRNLVREFPLDLLFGVPPVGHYRSVLDGTPAVEWDPERVAARLRNHPGRCWQAWEWLKIHPGGNVHPCCVAPPELKLGNLNEMPLAEILANGKRERLQAAFEADAPPEVCARCPLLRQLSSWRE